MIRETKVSSDWSGWILLFSLYVAKVFSASVTNVWPFSISVSYAVDDTGGGAREVVSDLNRSLGSQRFLYVMNERTSFAYWASALESSRLVIGLKWTFVQKVACVFVTFELNWWRLQKDSTSLWIVFKYFKVFENDVFNSVVVRVKCESEWKAISISLLSRL